MKSTTTTTNIKAVQAIKLTPATVAGKTLTKLAPIWFQDGVAERVRQGDSQELAIQAMQATSFFQKEWIA